MTAICHLLLSLRYWWVQYTSVSHCCLNFECPRLGYGFWSIILLLEKCNLGAWKSLKSAWILYFEFATNPVTSLLSSLQFNTLLKSNARFSEVAEEVGFQDTPKLSFGDGGRALVFWKTVPDDRNCFCYYCTTSVYWPGILGSTHCSHGGSTGNETWSHRYRRTARWPLENNLNVWWAQVLHTEIFRSSTLQQTTRHWWSPTTSCFGVTNHSEAASLWLVRHDRININSGSPPSCGASFWQWSVASPFAMGWLASKVSRYLCILCLLFNRFPPPSGFFSPPEMSSRCLLYALYSVYRS